MDYSCSKFGDFSFNRFGFIERTDRHAYTESQNAILMRPPSALSKKGNVFVYWF